MKTTLMKTLGLTEEQADQMVQQSADETRSNPWTAYDTDLSSVRTLVGGVSWADSRRTIEYIFVRDEPSAAAVSLSELIAETDAAGDFAGSERLKSERTLAHKLGLSELRIVQSLPILLAGFGFTRYFSNPLEAGDSSVPSQVVLRPYPTIDNKIPVYIARNTTEALLYDLDPWRLAAFLTVNTSLEIPPECLTSEPAIRAWLLLQSHRLVQSGESHFALKSFEMEAGITVDEISALVFGVIHTISHVLKATAHRYVGIDADSLAEYLFPAHAAGLLYVSTHVEFTLGGIDSVFRSNLTQWLASAYDYAGRCSFDPVCKHSGGACLACLYPKFGCAYFNRTVSRSFLLGGEIPGRSQPLVGYWHREVVDVAKQLRNATGTARME
jgi:hypothetical protein